MKRIFCMLVLGLVGFSVFAQPFQLFDKPVNASQSPLFFQTDNKRTIQLGGALLYGLSDFKTVKVAYQQQFKKNSIALSLQALSNEQSTFNWASFGVAQKLHLNWDLQVSGTYASRQVRRIGWTETALGASIGLVFSKNRWSANVWLENIVSSGFLNAYQQSILGLEYAILEDRLFIEANIGMRESLVSSHLIRLLLTEKWLVQVGFSIAPNTIVWGLGYTVGTFQCLLNLERHPILGITPKIQMNYGI